MCDPVTLTLAATAVATVGKGFSALQAASSHRYEARIADRNVGLENEAGRNAADNGRTEAARLYRQIGAVQGQQQAAMSANGIDTSYGSALQVQRDTEAMGNEDVAQLYKGTAEKIRGFDINASNYRSQAQASRQAAKGAIVKGVFDMASTALDGATQFGKLKAGRG